MFGIISVYKFPGAITITSASSIASNTRGVGRALLGSIYTLCIGSLFSLTTFGISSLVLTIVPSVSSAHILIVSNDTGTTSPEIFNTSVDFFIDVEILPNISSIIIVSATLALASNIGIEVALSFLGFGLPAATPSLGTLISYASKPEIIQYKLYVWLPAAIVLLFMMLGINYIGQALRRAADAKQRLG